MTSLLPRLPFLPRPAGVPSSQHLAFKEVMFKMEEAFNEGVREPAVLDLGVAEVLKLSNSPAEALDFYHQARHWLNQLRVNRAKPTVQLQPLGRGGQHE